MPFTVAEIAKHVGGEVFGDSSLVLSGFAPADRAQSGDLTFAENENYFARAEQSAASAVLVDAPFRSQRKTLIQVENSRVAFARVLPLFFPEPGFSPGVHPSALISPTATIDPSSYIGPYCVILEDVCVGAGAYLHGGNYLGAGSQIGSHVVLFPHVVIYPGVEIGDRVRIHAGSVIGSDGFGYVLDGNSHRKVPQIGNVIVREDVEIGANVTIDRGALGPTIIGKGSKIDNLVQIAHNVVIGENCLVVAQAGIAGSTRLGNFVVLAGQVGLAGHLKIGNRVSVAAKSGVMDSIPDGEKWFGTPAQPDRQTKRQILAIRQLPELMRRVADLERKLGTPLEPTESAGRE